MNANVFFILLVFALCLGQVVFGSIWKPYFEATSHQDQPYQTVVLALEKFDSENIVAGFALDLGCGTGRDTLYILKHGWTVKAIDAEKIVKNYLYQKIPSTYHSHLSFQAIPFEQLNFPKVMLINAGYSIPFCKPQHLNKLMERLTASILPNGRFSGHFFGKKDSRSANTSMSFLNEVDVLNFFKDFEIELFAEEEWDGMNASGPQHHHVYNIVAKKRGEG